MKRIVFVAIISAGFLNAARDPLDEVLAKGGLNRSDVHFDRELMDLYGGGTYSLRLFNLLANRPLEIPEYNKLFIHQLLEGTPSVATGVFFASMRTDESVRRGLISHPVSGFKEGIKEDYPKIISALDRLNQVAGKKNVIYDYELPQMPSELDEALAVLLLASAQSIECRNLAFRHLSKDEQASLREKVLQYVTDDTAMTAEGSYFVEDCIGRVEYSIMYAGLEDLALVLDSIVPFIDSLKSELPEFEFATPFGKVRISGNGDDLYQNEDYLLLIEKGGNDHYARAGTNPDFEHPVSVVIDLSGDDGYMNESFEPAIASGIMGAGFIIDLHGNDLYLSNGPGIGAGVFGLGLIYDLEGKDNYDGFANCEGAGVFGAGVLVDLEGDDTYRGFRGIQGYGFTKGCGLLLDLAGNDFYIARNDSLPFASPQTPDHNANMAQGFGFGKRADFTDGKSLAGGVGVLADGGGDDIYDAGVFSQGGGYWYGVGILTDKAGSDMYSGVWYVQGAAAHFAVGILDDVEGNDGYTAEMNMAQGAGHDFSVGYLYDESGDDTYNAPNLSLGGGNANGFGIFWDSKGDDIYNVTAATTLGLANIGSRGGIRDRCLCLGLFMDTGGGKDAYPENKKASNGKCWFNPGLDTLKPISKEIGAGIDE